MFGLDSSLSTLMLGRIDDVALIPLVAIVGGLCVPLVWIVASSIKSISSRKQREESRREIAAYVAEGSMTPDDAERILEAGMPKWEKASRRHT